MQSLESRFWTKVEFTDGGCWLWKGSTRSESGYGQFRLRDGITVQAHRQAYELAFGLIPHGLIIRHLCGVRLCVRPDHLMPGTPQENAADREQMKLAKMTAGGCPLCGCEEKHQANSVRTPSVLCTRTFGVVWPFRANPTSSPLFTPNRPTE